jgi:carbon-monoxide dehydrogenase medium subunit
VKPAPFIYHAPDSVEGAIDVLAANAGAKVLAGGQSLVPAMNFRLARPEALVDINRVAGLDQVTIDEGVLEIGALARHVTFEAPVEPGPLGRSLAQVARFVGHLPIRTRGTLVGSLAHADPAAEWCVVARTLDATMVAAGPNGIRHIGADAFFHTVFSTELNDDELLTSVRFPLLSDSHRAGFAEFARRAGDFALVMAYVVCELDERTIRTARIGLGGVSDRPIRVPQAEAVLTGQAVDAGSVSELAVAAGSAAADSVVPFGDIHGSPEYRTDLIRAMVRRATLQALAS